MKCAKCGAESSVLETRAFEHGTTSRRRECLNGHRFHTVEIYRECYGSTRERCRIYFEVTCVRYQALWNRNLEIARAIAAGVTWQTLAEKFQVSRSGVYNALRAGRNRIAYSNSDKQRAVLKEKGRAWKTPPVVQSESGVPKTTWR